MNSSDREIANLKEQDKSFLEINQKAFKELLTFVDFADDKLSIAFAEINFAQDRDLLIENLIEHPSCKDIQFEILDLSDPNLRFVRDELVAALKNIKIASDKKLILLITGLEKSIGILDEYPDVLVNLNFVRDDLSKTAPYPIIFFLPEYALTRLAKYAPDFWAWGRKVFSFKTIKRDFNKSLENTSFFNREIDNLELSEKKERIDLLLRLLSEYSFSKKYNPPELVNLYNQLGVAYYAMAKYLQAEDYHKKSLKIAREIGDYSGEADALSNLGNAYYSLGEYHKAIDFQEQSLKIMQRIEDFNGQAACLTNLGTIYNSLGKHRQAISFFQESLILQLQIKDNAWKANSLIGLGNAYECLKQHKRATIFFKQSLEIAQKTGNYNLQALSLNALGNSYNSLKEYQQAINFHQQSLEIAKKAAFTTEEARAYMGLGNAYECLEEHQQAICFHQQSLEIAQKINDLNGQAYSLNNIGNAYYSLGEYQQAINFHQQSLKIQQQIGDRRGEAIAWFNLGNGLDCIDEKLKAKLAYENALKFYKAIGLKQDVEECDRAIQELENNDSKSD